jgi:hypothetical protein
MHRFRASLVHAARGGARDAIASRMNKLLSFAFVTSTLAVACTPSLRAQTAGRVGCGANEVDIGPSTVVDGVETWTAWCGRTAYHCARQTEHTSGLIFGRGGHISSTYSATAETSCSPEISATPDVAQEPPRTTADSAPPGGAAGFSFHAALADAQARCNDAGKKWLVLDPTHATCDGVAANVGFDAKTNIELCAGEVCGVTLVAQPSGAASQWLAQYGHLRQTLESKYGDVHASSAGRDIEGCKGPALEACMHDGRVRPETLWRWQSGESLWLAMGSGPNGTVQLLVRYRDRPDNGPRVAL